MIDGQNQESGVIETLLNEVASLKYAVNLLKQDANKDRTAIGDAHARIHSLDRSVRHLERNFLFGKTVADDDVHLSLSNAERPHGMVIAHLYGDNNDDLWCSFANPSRSKPYDYHFVIYKNGVIVRV